MARPQRERLPPSSIRVAVDLVIMTYRAERLEVLLIRRKIGPYINRWALPGGFVRDGESVADAARRELREETGLDRAFIDQLAVFGEPNRDPRAQVISIAHLALIAPPDSEPKADTDAAEARWWPLADVPHLAFDHQDILSFAVRQIQRRFQAEPIGFHLLPERFTLTEVQTLFEAVFQRPLDKRNFRKKLISLDVLKATGEQAQGLRHRAPELFCFDHKKYISRLKQGYSFTI